MPDPMTGADVPAAAITPAMRDGIQLAIDRLNRLAQVHRATRWTGAFEFAAAALREELKIADPGRTT